MLENSLKEITVNDDVAYTRGLTTSEYLAKLDMYDCVYVRYPSSQILLNALGLTNVHVLPPRFQDYRSNPITMRAVVGESSSELARRALREYGALLEAYPSVDYLPTVDNSGLVFIQCGGYGEQPVGLIEECLSRGWSPVCGRGIVNYYPTVVSMVDFDRFASDYSL